MTWNIRRGFVALALALAIPSMALAQGGGASSTGTIQGRVSDSSGAVLPGVTVTATSPSMIGAQTQVSNENGSYRFPAVPPGAYTITFTESSSPTSGSAAETSTSPWPVHICSHTDQRRQSPVT